MKKINEIYFREQNFTVFEVLRKIRKDKIILDEFKKLYVWNMEEKSKLIESLIINLPISPYFVMESNKAEYVIVDGLQRINAILEFVDNSFQLKGLDILRDLNGMKMKDISTALRTKIEDSKMLFYVLRHDIELDVLYSLFCRINTLRADAEFISERFQFINENVFKIK